MPATALVMPATSRRTLAMVLVAGLAGPAVAAAQQAVPVPVERPVPADAEAISPPEPAEPPPPGASPAEVGGSWSGWAKLTNDWPGLSCHYEPRAGDEASVHLELSPGESGLSGSVAIDLPAPVGTPCPPLRKRYAIAEVRLAPGAAAFVDSGGNEWSLTARWNGTVLQGSLAWQQGGPEEPLAEGFETAGGTRPMSRLAGEVQLRHDVVEAPPAGGAGADAKKGGAGQHVGNVAKVLGANVVGLGLLYGVNEIGKGSSASGVLTCSPRVCVVGAPNAPCFCEGNVVSGAACGATTGGVPIGGACDGTTQPCQATLSCNSNVCEDRFGRCPY